jgi:hypothetical protein
MNERPSGQVRPDWRRAASAASAVAILAATSPGMAGVWWLATMLLVGSGLQAFTV